MLRKPRRFDHIYHERSGAEGVVWNMQDAAVGLLNGAFPGAFRRDANETMAFTRGLEYQFQEAYRVLTESAKGRSLMPVAVGTIPDGASSHTYTMIEEIGEADLIDDYADDFPRADIRGDQQTTKIVSFGVSWDFSIMDLRRQAMLAKTQGLPGAVDTEKATTARGAFERKLDKYLAVGESKVSLKGLANQSGTQTATASGQWFNSGGALIVTAENAKKDLESIAKKIVLATAGEFGSEDKAVRICLPQRHLVALATTPFSTSYQSGTILEEVLKSPFIESIHSWNRLGTASALDDARIVGFLPDPRVVQAYVPIDFEQMAPQLRNMSYVTNCHGRFGGVVSKYPIGICYMDGTDYHA